MRGGVPMNDSQIVRLYWDRDERAIPATAESYGAYCFTIAYNILNSVEDSEECVNDTYLRTWNSIPPHRPSILRPFLGKITRNLALHLYQRDHAQKRGGGGLNIVFDELAECVAGQESVEQIVDERELIEALNGFLATLPVKKRKVFVRRYWYVDSIYQIAARMDMTENRVSVMLFRLRSELKQYLEERGFFV